VGYSEKDHSGWLYILFFYTQVANTQRLLKSNWRLFEAPTVIR